MPSSQGTRGTNKNKSCKNLQKFFTLGNTENTEIKLEYIIKCFAEKTDLELDSKNNEILERWEGWIKDLKTDNLKDIIKYINKDININKDDLDKINKNEYQKFMDMLKTFYSKLYDNNKKKGSSIRRLLSSEKFEFINTCYDENSARRLKNSLDKLKNSCNNGCEVILALAANYAAMLSSGSRDVGKFEWYPYAANARVLATSEDSSIPLCPRWGDIFAILYYLALDKDCKSILNKQISRDDVFKCLLDGCRDSSSQDQ